MLSVGRYQLIETLGEGGMGVVYKALDPLIRRTVAVKLIAARLDASPELRQRFFSEARAAGQLSHRNIVTIYDLGEDNGHPYFAMEYLEGRNLRVRMQSFERMSLARKLEVMSHVCDGLAFAHSKGVTHRDVKPANIFITDSGEVKVLDFGLARLPASELTHSKTLIGTLNYMAPEQIAGEKTDQRTDVFAVGVVFYELLSGRSPFEADSVASLLNKILRDDPDPVSAIDPSIPPALNALVSRAMAKAREDRYQSLGELLIDLAECRALIRNSDPGSAGNLDVTREVPGGVRALSPGSGSSPSRPADDAGVVSPRFTPIPAAAAGSGPSAGEAVAPPRSRLRQWAPLLVALLLVAGAVAAATRFAWHRAAADGGTAHQPVAARLPAVPPAEPRLESPPGPAAGEAVAQLRGTGGADQPEERMPTRVGPGSSTAPTPSPGRAEAESARTSLHAAMASADGANASELAASTYRSASERQAAAGDLFKRRQYPQAAAKAYEATTLFQRAEIEARAEQARREEQARASVEPRKPDQAPHEDQPRVAVPDPRPPESDVKRPAGESAAPPPAASRPVAPPDPLPAPSASPAMSAASEQSAIREVLAKYVEALESRDLPALKRIWPTLSGTQERAMREEFDHARSIAVDLGAPSVEAANGTATVTCRRRYALVTQDGHHLESRTTSTFNLRRHGSSWVIDGVRHDAPR